MSFLEPVHQRKCLGLEQYLLTLFIPNKNTLTLKQNEKLKHLSLQRLVISFLYFRKSSSGDCLILHCASLLRIISGVISARTLKTWRLFLCGYARQRGKSSFSRKRARWPIFLLHNFGVQFILYFGRKKKDIAKIVHKTVTRGCNRLWPWQHRREERFESISFKVVWFFHTLYIKLFHMVETFNILFQILL